VIVFELVRAAAALAGFENALTAAARALPHGALHVCRDVVLFRGADRLARLRHEAVPLRLPVEHEIEARLEDLLHTRAGLRMREGVLGPVELLEEAARDVDVQP
jgi:hypothetical protein